MAISDAGDGAGASATGTKPGFADNDAGGVDFFDAIIQFLSRLAFRPLARATEATDTPGVEHSATTFALNSSLWRRRRRGPSLSCLVSMCPLPDEVDTILYVIASLNKMTWRNAYDRRPALAAQGH